MRGRSAILLFLSCQDGTGGLLATKWVVKDNLDQIQGPFSTEEILSQIKKGLLSGDEFIARYPDGKWKRVSTEPQFFDFMLELISEEDGSSEISEPKPEEDTEHLDPTLQLEEDDSDEEKQKLEDFFNTIKLTELNREQEENDEDDQVQKEPEKPKEPLREVKGRSGFFEENQRDALGELKDLEEKRKKTMVLKPFLYVFGVAFVILLVVFFLIPSEDVEEKENYYRFFMPRFGQKPLSTQGTRDLLFKAQRKFVFDRVKDHVEAQKYLNQVLASEPRNEDALKMLCFTYFRVWPFTKKGPREINIVSEVSKRAYRSQDFGEAAMTCRVVEMILRNQIKEAKNNISSYLNAEIAGDELSYLARYFNGYLLYQKRDFQGALASLESSVKLLSSWIPSQLLLGMVNFQLEGSQEAYNSFLKVLKINEGHPEALYYMSILNFEVFSQVKKGKAYFAKAEKVSEQHDVNRAVKSLAYSSYARVLLTEGKKNQAKLFAEAGFELDPGNITAKNIMMSIGGRVNTKSADRYVLAEAEQMFKEEEWSAAIALYEQAYRRDQRNGLAALRIAQSHWARASIQQAIEWAERSIVADPKLFEAYIELSGYLIHQYKFIEAGRVLAKARRLNSRSPEVYKRVAELEERRGNAQGAEEYARKSIQLYSNDVEAVLLLVRALRDLGEIEKAFGYARQALEIDGNSFEAQRLYAKLLSKIRGIDAAREYLENRIRRAAGNLEYNVILAEIYYDDEQFREAEAISRETNDALNEENKGGLLIYARASSKLGQTRRALDYFQRAFLLDPNDVTPLFEAAQVLITKGQNRTALQQFKRVQGINPNYPKLRYYWAKALKNLAKYEGSIAKAKEEIALNQNSFESYVLLSQNYYMLGKAAETRARKKAQRSDEYSEAYSEMVGWFKQCASSYQKSIEIADQSSDIYVEMARCYRLSGQIDQAKASADIAQELDKGNAKVWLEIAQIYDQLGNVAPAVAAYEKYILIFPNAPNRKAVELKIQQLKSMN